MAGASLEIQTLDKTYVHAGRSWPFCDQLPSARSWKAAEGTSYGLFFPWRCRAAHDFVCCDIHIITLGQMLLEPSARVSVDVSAQRDQTPAGEDDDSSYGAHSSPASPTGRHCVCLPRSRVGSVTVWAWVGFFASSRPSQPITLIDELPRASTTHEE